MSIKIGSTIAQSIVIPVYQEEKKLQFFNKKNKKIKEKTEEIFKLFNYEAKKESTLLVNMNNQKVLFIGLNKEYTLEELRRAYSIVFSILVSKKEKKVSIEMPTEKEDEIQAVIEGIDLSDYKFDRYLSEKEENKLDILLDISENFNPLLKKTLLQNKHVKFARNLVNENSYVITPKKLESLAKDFAKKNKLKIKTLDEKQIQKEKLNLIWAVGKGSENPPRLIIVEYNGNPKSKEKVAFVGKGITFDTGGTNLKPTGYVEDMRSDMGGAAAAMGAFMAAVEMKAKQNIILAIGSAENSLSHNSYKPGDVYVSHSGVSVEIGNTDAEGRLVLADTISYLQKNYKPTRIVDLATLTGACLVALGPSLIAMLGNETEMKKAMFEAGEKTYERVWELPLYDELRELNKSRIADIKNTGGRDGGTITAGAFLERFVDKKVKWVHLDIAGAAFAKKPNYYVPEFGTGRGVRLLLEYLNQDKSLS